MEIVVWGGIFFVSYLILSAKVKRKVAQVAPGFSAAELQRLEQAVAGPAQEQHVLAQGPSDAQAASASARARMAILWGALLLGVGVLGVMAWRLFRQVR